MEGRIMTTTTTRHSELICTSTGRRTRITARDIATDGEGLRAAADRLVVRDNPGHFVAGVDARHLRHLEICRSVGELTEHTGEFVDFEIG
jgi:hypothetical protein